MKEWEGEKQRGWLVETGGGVESGVEEEAVVEMRSGA